MKRAISLSLAIAVAIGVGCGSKTSPASAPGTDGGDGVCGANCDGYCQIALTTCAGANKIYDSLADCQASCAKAAADLVYSTEIITGDHVACLLNHAQAAAEAPDVHCLRDLAKDPTQPMVASRTCQ